MERSVGAQRNQMSHFKDEEAVGLAGLSSLPIGIGQRRYDPCDPFDSYPFDPLEKLQVVLIAQVLLPEPFGWSGLRHRKFPKR